jgi:GNAT superfamily N-acetyltransferase
MTVPPLAHRAALRPAAAADIGDISRIMNYPPEPPTAALFGRDRASRLGDLLVREGVSISLAHTTVAVLDGAVVGVMECGSQHSMRMTAARLLRLITRMLVILGPVAPRALRGLWLRQQVQFEPLPDAFGVAELYVAELLRNHGVGGLLLQHAEDLARHGGSSRMCLETGITNPARHLYERFGYVVVATKANAGYERMTGSPGRVLMVKDLTSPPP